MEVSHEVRLREILRAAGIPEDKLESAVLKALDPYTQSHEEAAARGAEGERQRILKKRGCSFITAAESLEATQLGTPCANLPDTTSPGAQLVPATLSEHHTCCGDSPVGSQVLRDLRHKLFHGECAGAHTALWDKSAPLSLSFGAEPIVVAGYCQLGKSREILLAAWRAVFEYSMVPYIFVRNHGGHEAVAQLKANLEDFNQEIEACCNSTADRYPGSLPPILVAKERYDPDSGDAQVIITLANASRIQQIMRYELPRLAKRKCTDVGRDPIVVICDEDDLNITSASRDRGKIEKAMNELRARAFQDVSVTATLTAVLLTATRPVRVTKMPLKVDYFGLHRSLPDSRQPELCEVGSCEDEQGLPKGLADMVTDMLSGDGWRVALVHAAKTKCQHTALQKRLSMRFSDDARLMVLTHNSGNAHENAAITLRASPTLIRLLPEAMNRTKVKGDSSVHAKLGMQAEMDADLWHFHKGINIQETLTMLQCLAGLEEGTRHPHAFGNSVPTSLRAVIISGQMGGRGVTFKSLDRATHLTDFFYQPADSASGESLIQTANRISGRYQEENPRLKMWTTAKTHKHVLDHADVVDELIEAVVKNPAVAPIFALDGYTLQKVLDHTAGDEEDDEVCLTQLTRPQVQANLVQHEKLFDSGKGPRCHGGALITGEVSDPAHIDGEELVKVAAGVFVHHKVERVDMLDDVISFSAGELPEDVHSALKDFNGSSHCCVKAFLQRKLDLPKTSQVHAVLSHQRHARDGALLRQGPKDWAKVVYKYDAGAEVLVAILRKHELHELQQLVQVQGAIYCWRAFGLNGVELAAVIARMLNAGVVKLCTTSTPPPSKKRRTNTSTTPPPQDQARQDTHVSEETPLGKVLKSAKELVAIDTNKGVQPYRDLKRCIEVQMKELPPPLQDKAKQAWQLVANIQGFKSNTTKTWRPQVRQFIIEINALQCGEAQEQCEG